jgi:hypothetical protein
MLTGKTHNAELLGKRVEMLLEISGFNASQDARFLEILVKQDASFSEPPCSAAPGRSI